MSSYFQSTFIYGIVLSEEEEKKLYSTIFYDNYYQNIKNERRPDAKKNFLSIEDTGETEGETPKNLISQFRNSFYPRIAVTVDMIATGTDIKPL